MFKDEQLATAIETNKNATFSDYDCSVSFTYSSIDSSVEITPSTVAVVEFDKHLYTRLREFSASHGIQIQELINILWGFLMERYHNKKDIVFGNFITTQDCKRKRQKIFAVRINSTVDKSVTDFIKSYAYQYVPAKIELTPETSLQYAVNGGLIHHSFCSNHKGEDTYPDAAYKFNIFLTVNYSERMVMNYGYNSKMPAYWNAHTITRHLERIAEQILKNSAQLLSEIELLSSYEKGKYLAEFNKEVRTPTQCILELFQEVVGKFPFHVAVSLEDKKLSYSQLNEQSDHLAAFLREKGVQKEEIIVILAERKIETVVGILGILKAGGAYLPIDIEYPQERIEYILADAKAKYLIYAGELPRKLPKEIETINLCKETSYIKNARFVNEYPAPDDLAYVIYTSGTTGKPKGVMIEHKSAVRLVKDTNYIAFNEKDRILQTGSMVFDASTLEIWGSLLNGSTLYLISKADTMDVSMLKSIILDNFITVMFLSSPYFQKLAEADISLFEKLRVLVVGGDVMSCKQATRVMKQNKMLQLINGYGPTENTTFSTCFRVDKDYEKSIPIGVPITNSTAYVIDCFGNLQAVGFPGELFVGGAGVARGYLNNEFLSKEKFTPMRSIGYERLYRTGDSVLLSEDGNIYYLGRTDQQVKINGFRIELSEIQARLLEIKGVDEAYVGVDNNKQGDKFISAYITGSNVDSKAVKEQLGCFLPSYMIPDQIVVVPVFPLNANGKLDINKLASSANCKRKAVNLPDNDIERTLCAIWASVLNKQQISTTDDFFELGGDSLKAMSLIMEAKKKGFNLLFNDIYKFSTVRKMALSESFNNHNIPEILDKDRLRLSFAQEGIWLNSKIEPIYNVVLSVAIQKKVNFGLFEQALKLVIDNNQEMRTIILEENYTPFQSVYDDTICDITFEKHSDKNEKELRRYFEYEETYRVYNLDKAPLFHFRVGESNDGAVTLTIGTHHVLADAYSINILLSQIDEQYKALLTNQNRIKKIKDYNTCVEHAEWQRKQYASGAYDEDIKYWMDKLDNNLSIIHFPPKVNSGYGDYEGGGKIIALSDENAELFKILCRNRNISYFAGYTTIFYMFLNYIFDVEDISIGTATVGRERSEIQQTMGNFAYASLLRATVSSEDSFTEMSDKIKEMLIEAYRHQTLPYEMFAKEAKVSRSYYKLPYTILIEYINNENTSTTLGFSVADYSNEITPADFTFFIQSDCGREYLHFYYKKRLFGEEEIEDFVSLIEDIFLEAISDPDKPVKRYQI